MSNLRPLLSITFPQGFLISKGTLGSCAKRRLNGTSKSEQTHERTNWLIDWIGPDFLLQKSKYGFNIVRLRCGKPGICSDNSYGTHSLRFWSLKSDYKWKSLRNYLEICPREVPRVVKLALGAAPLGKVWFPDNSCGFSTVCPRGPIQWKYIFRDSLPYFLGART